MSRRNACVLIGSAVVVALFALLLPFHIGDATSQATSAECMALSDKAPPRASSEAIALYERCLAIEPANAELLRDVGVMYETTGDVVQAEKRYRGALAIDPAYSDVHVRLGWLLLRRGDVAAARTEADAALALTINSRDALDLARQAGLADGADQ